MEENKYRDFNALVERCAGRDRKEQEKYLDRDVINLMKVDYGREIDFSEVIHTSGNVNAGKVAAAIASSYDANYFAAKMFLDDLGYDFMGLPSAAVDYMQFDLDQRKLV